MRKLVVRWLAASFVCLLALGTQIRAADTYLSDTDEGYKRLEELQKAVCEDEPTHPCIVSTEDCVQMLREIYERLLGQISEEDLNAITKICETRATRYETPGTHYLLSLRMEEVHAAAQALGVALPELPVFGGIAMREVNASVTSGEAPIILLNELFFEFGNELSKLATYATPRADADNLVLDEALSEDLILRSEVLRGIFIEMVAYLHGGPKLPSLEPSDISAPFQIVYFTALEDFALAHEYGHVVLDHGSSALFEGVVAAFMEAIFGPPPPQKFPQALLELEADIFALRIVENIQQGYTSDPWNPFISLLSALKFYFIAMDIMQLSERIVSQARGETNLPAPVDVSLYEADVSRVVQCARIPNCKIREIADLELIGQDGKSHPPPLVRLKIVEQLMTLPDVELTTLAEFINGNVIRLWKLTRDDFETYAEEKMAK